MYKIGLALSNNSAKLQNLTGSKVVYLVPCTHYIWHPTPLKKKNQKMWSNEDTRVSKINLRLLKRK